MASIEPDKSSQRFRIRFRHDGLAYKRSIRTKCRRQAERILARVEDTISLIERGRIVIPPDVDPASFILKDGKIRQKAPLAAIRSVQDLFTEYEKTQRLGFKEASTLKTEGIHLRHLRRLLTISNSISAFKPLDIQAYVNKRLSEKRGTACISAETVKKEVATFRTIWNWAFHLEMISKPCPAKNIQFPKRDEKPPFMTWREIEQRISRGGLAETEEKLFGLVCS